jgi:hypothetical protein
VRAISAFRSIRSARCSASHDKGRDWSEIDRIAEAHLHEVDCKLADLTALRRELKAVIDPCGGGRVADCRIIEALAP